MKTRLSEKRNMKTTKMETPSAEHSLLFRVFFLPQIMARAPHMF